MVGGISSLIGAYLLGPRIGKYTKRKNGKIEVHAIPGHSLILGALGCFILWFAWYGFNGAAAADGIQLAKILGTTTLAPATATVACMIYTWTKNGSPDVSMCLNAALAGLVAITAPCTTVDGVGAIIIGAVAGVLVVVEFVDMKLHVDDPVGTIAVHGANGLWGTIAEGLFNTESGLFYGGGISHLGVQCLGVLSIAAYTAVAMTLVFLFIKAVFGLRVTTEEELAGLDISEHGLASAYADFLPSAPGMLGAAATASYDFSVKPQPLVPYGLTVPAQGKKLTKVTIFCKEERFSPLRDAMASIGVTGMTVSHVMGCGAQLGKTGQYRGVKTSMNLLPQLQVDIVVAKVPPELVTEVAQKVLRTGEKGNGKIFVYNVENAIKVRTGEMDYDAMQGDD